MAGALTADVIEFLSNLARNENLKVTVFQAARGGAIAGGGAFVGALLGGPVGMALGAAAGGCLAAGTCKEFEPVYCIIMKMRPAEKEMLAGNFRTLMQRHSVPTIAAVTALMAGGNHAIRDEAIREIISFVTHELHRSIA